MPGAFTFTMAPLHPIVIPSAARNPSEFFLEAARPAEESAFVL
jgi:hypothetical protein